MIILDTNVVSELMRIDPHPAVVDWIEKYDVFDFAITSITVAEILRGIERLPKGKRREKLSEKFNEFLQQGFTERILPFDAQSARLFGDLCSHREKMGFHVEALDMMIASIAKFYQTSIATRNVSDFEGCGIEIINPWDSLTWD